MEPTDDDLTPLPFRDRSFTWPQAPPELPLGHHIKMEPISSFQPSIIQPSTSYHSPQIPDGSDGDQKTTMHHTSEGSIVQRTQPPSSDIPDSTSTPSLAYRGQFYGDPSIPPTSSSTSSKKPNPWGEQSYADLITQALYSSPTGRLKLNEVYQWFSDNVDFFRERSSTEAASGWKNSIRHNLSLHSRFVRVTNEGAGKSSWWQLNPDAKPGKSTRRRAQTMESGQRPMMEKKRQRAKRKVLNAMAEGSTGDVMISPNGDEEGGSFGRARSNSTLSNYSTPASRISPPTDGQPVPNAEQSYWTLTKQGVEGGLVDMTDNMRLMPAYRNHPYMVGGSQPFATPPNPTTTTPSTLQQLMNAPIKTEMNPTLMTTATETIRPPTYNDLYPRFGATGTLLREALQPGQFGGVSGLPFDIATIDCGNWQQMDIDTQAVIQHEMRYDGKLDFTGLEKM